MDGSDLSSMAPISRPELFDFEGISMVHFFTDDWENVQNIQARPDDILIATYPKAGTTWVSYILDLLYFGNTSPERQTSIPIYMRVPFLEAVLPKVPTGVEMVNNLPTTPRLIKTHLPVQLVPKSFWEQNCKVEYLGPRTVMVFNCVIFLIIQRSNGVTTERQERALAACAGDFNTVPST